MLSKIGLIACLLLTISTPVVFGQKSDDSYKRILQQYVLNGRVNYQRLCSDALLRQYTAQLADTNPAQLTSDAGQLAFWINAYNAWTLQIVCDNYPLKSINELHSGGLILGTIFKRTVWDKKIVTINKQKTSLNHIEHKIIRPRFGDPRAHFALVCASRGCPNLRSEPYSEASLNMQLEHQARVFLRDQSKNRYDRQKRIAYLSKIFDWFEVDFGGNDREVLLFVAKYLDDATSADMKSNPEGWEIKYTDYDWNLNE